MGHSQSLFLILDGVAVAVFAVALAVFARKPFAFQSRRAVLGAALIGGLLYTLPYWVLGDASFVFWDEEGEVSPPIYRVLLGLPDGARFAPALGGGNDAYAMFASGAQYVLPERFYLWLFPTWIAIALHKAVVFAVGFAGAYRLCRAATGCSRGVATAVGLLHPFSYWILVNVTFTHGTSYAILPLAVYVLVARIGKPGYWLGAVVMAAVLGVEIRPSHTLGALLLALASGTVLLGKTRLRDLARLCGAVGLIAVFAALNWHEVLYAMWQVAPTTLRGHDVAVAPGLEARLLDIVPVLRGMAPIVIAALLVAFASLAVRGAPFLVRGALAVLLFLALWLISVAVPWEMFGLAIVKGISPTYHLAAFVTLALPIIAAGAQALDETLRGRLKIAAGGAGLLAALVASAIAWHLINDASQLLYYGGQRQYTAIENLRDRSWRPEQPFRVVTLRRRSPEPNVVGGYYGFETFDASLNLFPHALAEWWEHAINLPDGPTDSPFDTRLTTNWRHWDGAAYRLDAHLRPPALAIANVAFVLSPFALAGEGITPVDEPAPDDRLWTFPAPSDASYYLGRLRRLFRPGKIFIYAVDDPLPRIYAASAVSRVAAGRPVSEFVEQVLANAPRRIATMRERDADVLSAEPAPLAVERITPRTDGFDVTLDAPRGGIVIVNQTFSPFWRAELDGQEAAIAPADLIHMAIAVPPGGQKLVLRYCRPLLRELVAARKCP